MSVTYKKFIEIFSVLAETARIPAHTSPILLGLASYVSASVLWLRILGFCGRLLDMHPSGNFRVSIAE